MNPDISHLLIHGIMVSDWSGYKYVQKKSALLFPIEGWKLESSNKAANILFGYAPLRIVVVIANANNDSATVDEISSWTVYKFL